jgi:hypothetical protein
MINRAPPPLITVEGLRHDCNSSVASLRLYSHRRNVHSHRAGIVHSHRWNSHGSAAACKIYAIELLNEGYGISIDDAVSEMQATFVARGISPLQSAGQVALVFAKWTFCILQPGFSL